MKSQHRGLKEGCLLCGVRGMKSQQRAMHKSQWPRMVRRWDFIPTYGTATTKRVTTLYL
jgi:hypothetical protein